MMRSKGLLFVPLLLLLLAACSPGTSAGGAPQPTALHVTRNALPEYTFPAVDVTIRDVAAVQRLYQSAYALQHARGGPYLCFADIGLEYQIDFLQGTTILQHMRLDVTGCQFLQIDHEQPVRLTNQAFRNLFSQTTGISPLAPTLPGHTSF